MRARRSQENRFLARKITKLTACPEDVTALTLSNKDIESRSPQHALKLLDNGIIGTAECIAGKFIERNQIDLASDPVQQLHQSLGILLGIIHPFQQDIFKRQTSVR